MTKTRECSTLFLLAVICSTALLVASCNNNPPVGDGKSVVIPVPNDTSALAKINHFIPEAKIKEYQSAFQAENDSLRLKYPSLLVPDAEAFNKPALLAILKDPRCVGIRIYHGVKKGGKRNEIRVILVGVDSQGKDLYISNGSALATDITQNDGGIEYGQCPTCASND